MRHVPNGWSACAAHTPTLRQRARSCSTPCSRFECQKVFRASVAPIEVWLRRGGEDCRVHLVYPIRWWPLRKPRYAQRVVPLRLLRIRRKSVASKAVAMEQSITQTPGSARATRPYAQMSPRTFVAGASFSFLRSEQRCCSRSRRQRQRPPGSLCYGQLLPAVSGWAGESVLRSTLLFSPRCAAAVAYYSMLLALSSACCHALFDTVN